MKGWAWWIVALFFLSSASALLEINEISYAPTDDFGGQYNEWIEIWNNGNETINLSGCFLDTRPDENPLPPALISPEELFIIARKPEIFRNISSFNGTIIPLVLSLANTEDTITLNGTCTGQFTYNSSLGALKNNRTLERREDNTWGESLVDGGTPGTQNSIWHLKTTSPDIVISELLPNPFGADDDFLPGGEWVELFNNGSISVDLRGAQLQDQKGGKVYLADTNTQGKDGLTLCPHCYLLVYRNGDSDFSLDTDYDEITLFSRDLEILTRTSYSGSKEGYSWQRNGSRWILAFPTPLAPLSEEEPCDVSLSLGGNFTSADSSLPFSVTATNHHLSSVNITVLGKIETGSGTAVKNYSPWTDSKILSSLHTEYSPALSADTYLITFIIVNMSCSDTHPENNIVQQLYLRTDQTLMPENSTLSVENINLGSDKKARWGDQLLLKLHIYKGNETKNEIRVWAEHAGQKVSKATSFLLKEKNHVSTITIPLQLDANCRYQYPNGTITLIIEGLGQRTEESVPIEGVSSNLCMTTIVTSNATASRTSRAAAVSINIPSSIPAGDRLPVTVQVKGAVSSSAPLSYELSGHVYRGKKCYSCQNNSQDPDANPFLFFLESGEEKEQTLFLKLDPSTAEGTYKVKVRLRQEGLKNPKETTAEVYVLPASSPSPSPIFTTLNSSLSSSFTALSLSATTTHLYAQSQTALPSPINRGGLVVYESTSAKAKKTIPYFLIISFALLTLGLVFFRKA
ncbi:lamin tail domain-containing protein [Candidatus Woesearchaeota archaeon]|nr:lamin tail domain-containing protein [Candidatus Woesearchaeota archaeon]